MKYIRTISLIQRLYIEILVERKGKVELRKHDSCMDDFKDWFKVKYGTSFEMKVKKWWYRPLFDQEYKGL